MNSVGTKSHGGHGGALPGVLSHSGQGSLTSSLTPQPGSDGSVTVCEQRVVKWETSRLTLTSLLLGPWKINSYS